MTSAGGDQFSAKAYPVDPAEPIGSIKEAWEAAKLRAGKMLMRIDDEECEKKGALQSRAIAVFTTQACGCLSNAERRGTDR